MCLDRFSLHYQWLTLGFSIVLCLGMYALLLHGKKIRDPGQDLGPNPDLVLDHGQDQGRDLDQGLGQEVVALAG